MKTTIVTFACLLLFVCVTPVQAANYKSDLGYSITLPEGWTVLDKKITRDRPEIVDGALEAAHDNEGLSALPAKFTSQLKELLLGGKIDYYYSPDPRFNISVYKGMGQIPQSSEGVTELCNSLPEELSKATGMEITVDQCESRTIANRPGLYLHADDYWKGRKYIQYQIETEKGEILFFTANSNGRDFRDMKEEFEQAMDSLTLNATPNQ
jgi:hypothetical protein